MKRLLGALPLAVAFCLAGAALASPGRYMEVPEFLEGAFGEIDPQQRSLIITGEMRSAIEALIEHRFVKIRVRYWVHEDTTAWIFDEIGKTEPITIGVSVSAGRVDTVRILEFRESRGWEVRYPFFTDQFTGAALATDVDLDRPVDGITGATLSVTAVDKVVRLALFLSGRIERSRETERAAQSS